MRIQRSPRGYMLAIVFGMIFFLLTIVAAIHHQQMTARREYTRASAELSFEQGRRFAASRALLTNSIAPSVSVDVSGSVDPKAPNDELSQASLKLWQDLPNLAVDDDSEESPAHIPFSVTPKTYDSGLKVFADRTYKMVARESDAYAIYAPKGSITVSDSVVGWANPTFKHSNDDAERVTSGVPAMIYAEKEIAVGDLRYGSAYSAEGPVDLGDGLSVGFIGPGPKRDYAESLRRSLDSVRRDLDANAKRNGDKTSSIKGGNFEKLEKVVELFKGDSDLDKTFAPTLEEAMGFNMPIIPGATKHPPFIFEFWFNVPWVSDFADFGEPVELDNPKDKEDRQELKRLNDQYEAAVKKVQELEAQKSAATTDRARDAIQKKLDDAIDDREDKKEKLSNASDDYQDKLKENEKNVSDKIPAGPADPPTTRREDEPRKKNKNGTPGHNYSGLFANMWELLTGDQSVLDTLAPKVRLVHFGGKDNNADDNFDFTGDSEIITAVTWTVPRGRCFRYSGNLVVTGDVWVQRGAIFAVDGDLTLQNPKISAVNPLTPKGRLHLEEGATLIVNGDFTAAGNLGYGSVQVAGLPGEIHPITSAILCTGAVSLPYGSYSATTLDDLTRWVGTEAGVATLTDAADTMAPIFTNVVPNLAKIAGPFHMRKVYFAEFAATFVLVTVPTPIGIVPVPAPTFLPRKNSLVPVFKGLTYLYTPMMNWNLGENLYTHADWWVFGDGAVPVLPKIDPIRAARGLQGLNLSRVKVAIDWESELESQSTNIIEKVVEKVFVDIIQKIGLKIAASAIPYGGAILVDTLLDELLSALELEETSMADLVSDLAKRALEPFETAMKSVLSQLEAQIKDGINDGLLRELSGVLIYADTIDVGYQSGGASTEAMVTSGMFVAKNGVRMNCRTTVGTVCSMEGHVDLKRLLYVPYFSRASLYKPKDVVANDFVTRGVSALYGEEFDSQSVVDVGTGAKAITAQGWDR